MTSRRAFLASLGAAATGYWNRAWRALRTIRYPGRVVPLDMKSVRQPGKWAG